MKLKPSCNRSNRKSLGPLVAGVISSVVLGVSASGSCSNNVRAGTDTTVLAPHRHAMPVSTDAQWLCRAIFANSVMTQGLPITKSPRKLKLLAQASEGG